MTLRRKEENLKILTMLKDAIKSCCEKYEISSWPIAVSIDIPNACIRTGLLDDRILENYVLMKHNSFVELTTDIKYWNKCDQDRVFMDDPYTFPNIKVGTEVSISFGKIVMICTEIRSKDTVRCQIRREGVLLNTEFLTIRSVKHLRPPMGKYDMELLQFALENKEADAIVLAREFLAQEIDNKHLMVAIQMQICAKCRSLGIPIYISGSILENVLQNGQATGSEISDITNIVLQGGGLFLRSYRDPNYILRAMHLLNSICKSTETVAKSDFWDLVLTPRVPVNAAEAATLGCAILARQTLSKIIIVLTVTGKSAVLVSRWCPEALIITVSADEFSARKLLLYRGIMPLIYKEKPQKNWYDEMNARIDYATEYAVKHDILKYGQNYVVLRKSSPTTSYADSASARKVFIGENKRQSIVCEDTTDAKHDIEESLFSFKTLSRVLN